MNHPTATIQPPLDLEAMWQNSLIRVSDQLTIPPVVLRVDEAIIGTLGNFSVSTGKAKAKKTFNVCALVAAALINGQVLEYRASFPESKRDILYFDTEQSPYHCQLVMQRILSLAGLPLDQEPEHLKFSHLRAIAAPNQRRALIRYAIYNSPNLGLVIIDGIRDLMHDINNSAEATNLVGDLMQWTGEKNIHIQTVLHLNKGDDKARGHIGTELNNKAESVLLIAKDTKDADRSVVSPAVIRSKAFAPFAFKLSEDDGICLPELDTEFAVTNSPSFSYQELSGEEHRKALQETFKTDTELGYGVLLTHLSTAYQCICGRTYDQTKLKELLRFLLNKRMIVKAGRGLKKSDIYEKESDVFSFLWEISYKTSDKTFFALGFANDAGGWELRNPYFKGCMAPKSISTIKGKDGQRLQIFEGFMDFLSWRKLHPEIAADSIVLNSLALLPKVTPLITSYTSIECFLDNDVAGRKAFDQLKRSCPHVIDGSVRYQAHKDLNEWLVAQSRIKEKQPLLSSTKRGIRR